MSIIKLLEPCQTRRLLLQHCATEPLNEMVSTSPASPSSKTTFYRFINETLYSNSE